MVKGARLVAYGNDEGDLVGLLRDFHVRSDDEEAGAVAVVEENIFLQDGKAVQLGSSPSCNGRLVLLPVLCNLLGTP